MAHYLVENHPQAPTGQGWALVESKSGMLHAFYNSKEAAESEGKVERYVKASKHFTSLKVEKLEAGDKGPWAQVRIIQAGMSKNRTLYPADVLAAGAHLYSKIKMMLDHPFYEYSVRDLGGIYGEAEWNSVEQSVEAPLHFLVETEAGQRAYGLALAEQRLRAEGVLGDEDYVFGISHVAYVQGEYVEPDAEGNDFGYAHFKATRIDEVLSGDMVVFDAANGKVKELAESFRKTAVTQKEEAYVKPASTPKRRIIVNVLS